MSPSGRPRRSRLLVVAVGLLLGLSACSQQRAIPDKYGDTTRDNFTEGCIDAMTQKAPSEEGFSARDLGATEPATLDQATAACTCTYEGIIGPDGIPFEEFKTLNEKYEDDPEPLPPEFIAIVDSCRGEAGLS